MREWKVIHTLLMLFLLMLGLLLNLDLHQLVIGCHEVDLLLQALAHSVESVLKEARSELLQL